jgi:hypothetical protein
LLLLLVVDSLGSSSDEASSELSGALATGGPLGPSAGAGGSIFDGVEATCALLAMAGVAVGATEGALGV